MAWISNSPQLVLRLCLCSAERKTPMWVILEMHRLSSVHSYSSGGLYSKSTCSLSWSNCSGSSCSLLQIDFYFSSFIYLLEFHWERCPLLWEHTVTHSHTWKPPSVCTSVQVMRDRANTTDSSRCWPRSSDVKLPKDVWNEAPGVLLMDKTTATIDRCVVHYQMCIL